MKVLFLFASTAVAAFLLFAPAQAQAGDFFSGWSVGWGDRSAARFSRHPRSEYYRGKPQVRAYRRRVGGYSYGRQDTLFFDVAPRIKYGIEPNYATLPSVR